MGNDEPRRHLHEQAAIQEIEKALAKELSSARLKMFSNIELFDPSTQSYYECDLILIAPKFIAIVDLKNWFGETRVTSSASWIRNGQQRRNPHRTNNQKCRILKSWLNTKIPSLSLPWIQSVIVITHAQSSVTYDKDCAAQKDSAESGQTTYAYESVNSFVEKFVRGHGQPTRNELTAAQVSQVAHFLEKLNDEPRRFRTQIDGFDVVKAITETPLYAEYLAVPQSPVDNKLKKLRIYGALKEDSREAEQQLRSFRTIERLPAHPNILKVHLHSNEKRLLVEWSEWSDIGTLRDYLQRGRFDNDIAESFIKQILSALKLLDRECIVHRDIRPENILVTGATFQLTNFDIAFDPVATHTVMSDERAKALHPYKAPEILERRPECKSDMFSFGVVLFEALTGTPPIKSFYDLKGGGLSKQNIEQLEDCGVADQLIELLKSCVNHPLSERPTAAEALALFQDEEGAESTSLDLRNAQEDLRPDDACNVWRIVSKISAGATAGVYKAIKGGDQGEEVALKVFNIDQPIERVRKEREYLRKSSSPFVVRCNTDLAWTDGRRCLELEYIEGPTLRELIDQGRRPDLAEFYLFAKGLMEALSSIHDEMVPEEYSQPIVHSDLTPSNIIRTSGGPKIIDFGVASEPGLGTYSTSPRYVPPDAVIDGELNRTPELDRYSIAITLHEWLTGSHPFPNQLPNPADEIDVAGEGLPSSVVKWFKRALSADPDSRFDSAKAMLLSLQTCENSAEMEQGPVISHSEVKSDESSSDSTANVEVSPDAVEIENLGNQSDSVSQECDSALFVDYLNGLHSASGSNQFVLAESQATNKYFSSVYVENALVERLFSELTTTHDQVIILTGHAGDGKSTIGLDLFKRLSGLPLDQPLTRDLLKEEILTYRAKRITIVKDMSDATAEERIGTLKRAFSETGTWLVIANTGPLLTAYSRVAEELERLDSIEAENEILRSLSAPIFDGLSDAHVLRTFDKPVYIANLSIADNVPLATEFAEKVVSAPYWKDCTSCPAQSHCPIVANVRLLREQSVRGRLASVYRRLAAYGHRMTARQITGQLCFSITAGLKCSDVIQTNNPTAILLDNIFSNSFFGFRGPGKNREGNTLHIINLVNRIEFGAKSFQLIDVQVAGADGPAAIKFACATAESLWNGLKARRGSVSTPDLPRYRQQMRRFAFLFSEFAVPQDTLFRDQFLKSSMLRDWENWLVKGLSAKERKELTAKTLSVLSEEFTGFRQFVGNQSSTLYLTLRRSEHQVPQNVQLVLASFAFDNFDVELDKERRSIVLKHRFMDSKNALELSLPMLDFIAMRSQGELGERLDPVYLNRLKLFKSKLLAWYRAQHSEDGIMRLLETTMDGNVRECQLSIEEGKLDATYRD